MDKTSIKIWMMAFRPKTLSAGIAPVLVGTSMAFGDGVYYWPAAVAAFFAALTIQISTNLANDYFDFKNGADTIERIGPVRVTQAGMVSSRMMVFAIVLFFFLSGIAYIWLVYRAGWPIAVPGILALLSAIFYTAGPRPLGYIGLGEVLVLIFFGPVAVGGTYYVQSLTITPAVILAGFSCGLLSSAILVVNNLRDIETDRKSGKITLAVRFGRSFARLEYVIFIILASLIPPVIYIMMGGHIQILFTLLIPLIAVPGVITVFTKADGPSLNKALAYTGALLIIFSVIFAAGWIL